MILSRYTVIDVSYLLLYSVLGHHMPTSYEFIPSMCQSRCQIAFFFRNKQFTFYLLRNITEGYSETKKIKAERRGPPQSFRVRHRGKTKKASNVTGHAPLPVETDAPCCPHLDVW